jgi:DNA-binding NarL/FixJ family response regulator
VRPLLRVRERTFQTCGVILGDDPDINVVGQAANGREALEQIAAVKPDVVIMDLAMPDVEGVEATRRVLQGPCPCTVVVLTTSEETHNVSRSLEAGATAYVVKRRMARDLIPAVRCVSEGVRYISPAVWPGDL